MTWKLKTNPAIEIQDETEDARVHFALLQGPLGRLELRRPPPRLGLLRQDRLRVRHVAVRYQAQ